MLDYDAWLEKPYQDACEAQEEFDVAAERYLDSDSEWEHFVDYATKVLLISVDMIEYGTPMTMLALARFRESSSWETGVEWEIERMNAKPDPDYDGGSIWRDI